MKLRLQLILSPDDSHVFEHEGPSLRLGRDPELELPLGGEECHTVSWHHARIELTPRGAFLSDLGSTNGTLLNDRRVAVRTAVKVGDEIQLGHTGPLLKVLVIDLTAPPPVAEDPALAPMATEQVRRPAAPAAPPPAVAPAPAVPEPAPARVLATPAVPSSRSLVTTAALAGGCMVLLLAVIVWRVAARNGAREEKVPEPGDVAAAETRAPVPVTPPREAPQPPEGPVEPVRPPVEKAPVGKPPSEKPPPPPVVGLQDPPEKSVDAGRYVMPAKAPPSVLLQRQREPLPWARLRPENRIYTGNYLVSLPGYRSRLDLDSGVQLILWGNVPEFSATSPVLESAVLLHPAPAGFDADFTLDRGRVLLLNAKPAGPARVRVRFLREVWDLTLQERASEAVVELWGIYPPGVPFSRESPGKGLVTCLGLFTKGPVGLAAGARKYELTNLSQVVWSNVNRLPLGPETLPQLPPWWTDRIAPEKDSTDVADVMLALKDYSDFLAPKDEKAIKKEAVVLDVVRTRVRESSFPAVRKLGVLFLGALDALPELIEALEDRRHPQVRGTAREVLQRWEARSPDHDLEFYRVLQEKQFSPEKAETIVRLLHTFSRADLQKPETYEFLLHCLNHENLAIRDLALWHLTWLFPEAAARILFDAQATEEERKPAYEQWQKVVQEKRISDRATGAR